MCVCMSACACDNIYLGWGRGQSSVILRHPQVVWGHWGGRCSETCWANTQKAKRVDNRRGQGKHTHTLSAPSPHPPTPSHRVTSLFHTRTQSFSPSTPPPAPPSCSAIVDLWSSRRSMALRGDQARLHTSGVKRRSTRALKPCRTFCSATSRRPAATAPFSADREEIRRVVPFYAQ